MVFIEVEERTTVRVWEEEKLQKIRAKMRESVTVVVLYFEERLSV